MRPFKTLAQREREKAQEEAAKKAAKEKLQREKEAADLKRKQDDEIRRRELIEKLSADEEEEKEEKSKEELEKEQEERRSEVESKLFFTNSTNVDIDGAGFQAILKKAYSDENIDLINENLFKIIKAKEGKVNEEELKKFRNDLLSSVVEVAEKRHEILRQQANVNGHITRVKYLKANPGKVDDMLQHVEMLEREGRGGEERDSSGGRISAAVRGLAPTIKDIKNRRPETIGAISPSEPWDKNIRLAGEQLVRKRRRNDLELLKIISPDKKISKKYLDSAEEPSAVAEGALGMAELGSRFLSKVLNKAGRGTWSAGKPEHHSIYDRYQKLRNKLALVHAGGLKPGSRSHADLIRETSILKQYLENDGELLDVAAFNDISKLMEDQLALENKEQQAELIKMTEDAQKLNAAMLESIKGVTLTEDQLLKYRVLQIFLMMSPFAMFSPLSMVFDYVDLIGDFFGPLFKLGNVSKAIGDAATNAHLGFLGDFAHILKIDYATTWLLDNVPIVNSLLDVWDGFTDNKIAQNLFGAVSGADHGLIMIGVAGLAGLVHGEKEMNLYKKKNVVEKSGKEGLEKMYKAHEATQDASFKKRVADSYAKEMAAFKKGNVTVEMVKFLADNKDNEELLKLLSTDKFSFWDNRDELQDLESFIKKIVGDADNKITGLDAATINTMQEKFLLFSAMAPKKDSAVARDKEADNKEKIEEYKKASALPDDKKKALIYKSKRILDNNLIVRVARSLGQDLADFETRSEAEQDKIVKDLEVRFARDSARRREVEGLVAPNSTDSEPLVDPYPIKKPDIFGAVDKPGKSPKNSNAMAVDPKPGKSPHACGVEVVSPDAPTHHSSSVVSV